MMTKLTTLLFLQGNTGKTEPMYLLSPPCEVVDIIQDIALIDRRLHLITESRRGLGSVFSISVTLLQVLYSMEVCAPPSKISATSHFEYSSVTQSPQLCPKSGLTLASLWPHHHNDAALLHVLRGTHASGILVHEKLAYVHRVTCGNTNAVCAGIMI
jgi:hypothetical protein